MNNQSLNETSNGDVITAKTVVIATILVTIIAAAIVGNAMVIVSVLRFDKLRIRANSFIVSLAAADLLVALLVMPFSATQEIAGRWPFTELVCDVFNADDVLFSTASLLHICCISMDRYIAITDPFGYDRRMTRRRVALMIGAVWTASALLSHVPVHQKWYAKTNRTSFHDDTCEFNVNRWYGVLSSTVSFWAPAFVMVFTYIAIFREARRQERFIAAMTQVRPSVVSSNHREQQQQQQPSVGRSTDSNGRTVLDEKTGRKMKREHKAAKTLGIIMGAFLLCWLPFFTWYLTDAWCQGACDVPRVFVSALFWIGYTNSALNPGIYACFNRDFRMAFKRILRSCGRRRDSQFVTTTTTTTTTSERISLKMNEMSRSSITKI